MLRQSLWIFLPVLAFCLLVCNCIAGQIVVLLKNRTGRRTYVWLSPLGLKNHATTDAMTTRIRPTMRLHLFFYHHLLVTVSPSGGSMLNDKCVYSSAQLTQTNR